MLPPFFEAIGSDRYLTADEVVAAVGRHDRLQAAWDLYQRAFGGFCETRLDPQFHGLKHPARRVGSVALDADDPVVIVGTGPSLNAQVPALARVRPHVRVFTSPRGAAVLARHGITPDLVLVEHRTALDAHHSARSVLDGTRDPLASATLVAAEWRTPASLLANVPADRLFVPEPLPTWGAWPATLTAMAIAAGARQIALLGVDLGRAERPDPTFAPLMDLLSLLSTVAPTRTADCGVGGAPKDGWPLVSLDDIAGARTLAPMTIARRPALLPEQRRANAITTLHRLLDAVDAARAALSLAGWARGGAVDVPGLGAAADELLAWQHDPRLRVDIQERLGASFLPRLWRTGIDTAALGPALWRPVLLASHELIGQADRLEATLRKEAA